MNDVTYVTDGKKTVVIFHNLVTSDGRPIEEVITDEFLSAHTTLKNRDDFYQAIAKGHSLHSIAKTYAKDETIQDWAELKKIAESFST